MDNMVDWQNACHDIKSRGQYILETEKWTDCRFLVGNEQSQQQIAAHKLILAMASPVFERMFFGNLPDKSDPILIPDVQPDAFRAMMEYIYSDKIEIASFDKACELCYVAKKYLLPHVVEHCTQFLWSDLSAKNACRAYEFAKLFEEPRLMEQCVQIISTKTREVLADPNFSDIELTTLLVIFDQDQLSIDSELDLFNAINKYAQERGYFSKEAKHLPKPSGFEESLAEQQEVNVEEMPIDADTGEKEDNIRLSPKGNSSGEGTSDQHIRSQSVESESENSKRLQEELMIKEGVKKIRFLTLTPQQFAEGPARSSLLTQAEALAILINISSPNIDDCPMPAEFCTNRTRRNCVLRCEEPQALISARNIEGSSQMCTDYSYVMPGRVDRNSPFASNYNMFVNPNSDIEVVNTTMETRKFYCVRTIRQHIDYRNTSVTDCSLTFHVDKNIFITGVQVPTQVLCGELMSSDGFTERYSEILYAHLLDAQGSRLTYTHCTSRVRYDSLLEISFDRPVFIHRHKVYKIGVVFNKVGWYPMYTCFSEVCTDNVNFMFNVGGPHESLRDGLIRAIVFTHPYAPSGPHSYAMVES